LGFLNCWGHFRFCCYHSCWRWGIGGCCLTVEANFVTVVVGFVANGSEVSVATVVTGFVVVALGNGLMIVGTGKVVVGVRVVGTVVGAIVV
jgi:hypothetical protein